MKHILALLVVFFGVGVAKAGHPYYYYYEEPQFYVAPQLIPVVVHHKNFIDSNGKQRVQKIEVFAPVYVEQHTFYYRQDYPPRPRSFRR